jgi:hypothetical protein
MTSSAQQLLQSFDLLPDTEKREVVWEILRRALDFDLPAFSGEELILGAEELFFELDHREAHDERS